jgi:hypothetical protein
MALDDGSSARQLQHSTLWNWSARSTRCHKSWSRIGTSLPNRSHRQRRSRHWPIPRRRPRLTYRLRVSSVTREGWSSASSPRTTARSSSRLGCETGSVSVAAKRSSLPTDCSTNFHWGRLPPSSEVSAKSRKCGPCEGIIGVGFGGGRVVARYPPTGKGWPTSVASRPASLVRSFSAIGNVNGNSPA